MRVVWGLVATVSLLFWSYGAFDMWATLKSWPPYQEQYGAEMFAWIQGFPLWRKAIWGASIALGVIGSLLIFARSQLAGPALLLAWLLLAGGFAYDLVLQDGLRNYGQAGVIASAVLVMLAALFAWAGFAGVRAAVVKPIASPVESAPSPSPVPVTQSASQTPLPPPAPAPQEPAIAEPGPEQTNVELVPPVEESHASQSEQATLVSPGNEDAAPSPTVTENAAPTPESPTQTDDKPPTA